MTAAETKEFARHAHLADQRIQYLRELVDWLQRDITEGGVGVQYFGTFTFQPVRYKRVGRRGLRAALPQQLDELGRARWDLVELTVSRDYAKARFDAMIKWWNEAIHGGRFYRGCSSLYGLCVYERHKSGRYHLHALVGGVRCYHGKGSPMEGNSFMSRNDMRKWWNKRHGFAFVGGVTEAAAAYCAKYVTKEIAPTEESTPAGFECFGKWPASSGFNKDGSAIARV